VLRAISGYFAMKIAWMSIFGLVLLPIAAAQNAAPVASDATEDKKTDVQDPGRLEGAVPVRNEPHHGLVFENDYVHVFNVTVPPRVATLLHQHDLPYIFLTLGTGDVINAVSGKPEVHLTFEDGTTRYTPGGFAHIARTDAGILFHNITVELVKPQAAPGNLGDNGKQRPLGSCPQNSGDSKQNGQNLSQQMLPCFETSELRMELVRVEAEKEYAQGSPETAALLIAMSDAELDVSLGGRHAAILRTGDVLWLPASTARKVEDLREGESKFLVISFKDSGATPAK
jgi:quercetin dioxygenase-like cupin family protein